MALISILVLMLAMPVRAEFSEPSLAQWTHRSWLPSEGAPTEVVAMAQTRDGYLWLGTSAGLFRFDGVRFHEFRPAGSDALPSLNISSLHALTDGGLLVGYRFGGISRIEGQHLRHFGTAEGVPSVVVYAFAEERSGVLWAASLQGLLRFEGGHWERMDSRWNYPAQRAYEVLVDRSGTVWADDGTQLLKLPLGARRFEPTGLKVDRAVLQTSAGGDLWVMDAPHRLRVLHASGAVSEVPDWSSYASPNAMVSDAEGRLWVAGYQDGIHRVSRLASDASSPLQVEPFGRQNGMTSNYALSVLEDREGTVWVGTRAGLDQFRPPKFRPVALPESAVQITIAPGANGELWAGGVGALLRADANSAITMPTKVYSTTAIRAPDGSVWMGGPGRLWRIDGGKVTTMDIPPEVGTGDVQAIAVEPDGDIWVAIVRAGLFRWSGGQWRKDGGLPGLPGLNPLVAAQDSQGRTWFGYPHNAVAMLSHGRLTVFTEADGISLGNITAIATQGSRLWIGGEMGVAYLKDGRFVKLRTAESTRMAAVSGLVVVPSGDLWAAERHGVFRIRAEALEAAITQPDTPVSGELFNYTDGLPGVPQQHRPLPSAVLGTDGRLWVSTANGLAWIDPGRDVRNHLAPPISLETVTVGTSSWATDTASLVLPAGSRDLSIAYSALSLARPERVRFSYRLIGSSEQWSEPTARREAFFTNLGPGRYRFEVIAANDSGLWNRQAERFSFDIAPFFWQTAWFKGLCVALVLGVLYALYVLRLRQMSVRLQQRLSERLGERERIARELHDTVLQSVHGLMLQIHRLAKPGGVGGSSDHIERALSKAEAVIQEGRDRVVGLRQRSHAPQDLEQGLSLALEQLATGASVARTLDTEGAAWTLDPLQLDDLLPLVGEALFNAAVHAHATRIAVRVRWMPHEVAVSVMDDGNGISEETLTQGGRPGHFGLTGMRERALRIGAVLQIGREDPRGTRVEVRVPRRGASRPGLLRRWLRRSRQSWPTKA
ncbi:two-component regulator propeller domain-containing protein [Roseateles sp. YR242]|uniref:sensor histidine kinase n=1 Tax=Roseateles sp. YR242 TaxID=1855305 RepID=UPI0015A52DAE|nr:two-component regulator propeller domain-containing protein [Roseateles sp. YR242]